MTEAVNMREVNEAYERAIKSQEDQKMTERFKKLEKTVADLEVIEKLSEKFGGLDKMQKFFDENPNSQITIACTKMLENVGN